MEKAVNLVVYKRGTSYFFSGSKGEMSAGTLGALATLLKLFEPNANILFPNQQELVGMDALPMSSEEQKDFLAVVNDK